MRFTPGIRVFFRKLWKEGRKVSEIADFFGTTRKTVYRWVNRAKHKGRECFKDKPRKPRQGRITVSIEVSVLGLRSLGWGTARIQQGLCKLPDYLLESLPFNCVQGVRLSRTAINNTLTRHGVNGYQRTQKSWKFFRAKEPDELWQIDLKGPFTVQG
jgi:putative transposase